MLAETTFEDATATTFDVLADKLLDDNNEATLVTQARNGSMTAVENLVVRYERRLLRLAQRITGNHEDAEEVVQNAFVKGFQNLAAFRGDSRFYTWIVRIAVNEALMRIRGKRFREVAIDDPDDAESRSIPSELEDWGPNPEECYSQEELRRILETAVSELDHGHRIVFQLRDIEGFSTEETARTLQLSLSAVKSRLQRARLQLRDSLNVYFRPPKRLMGAREMATGCVAGRTLYVRARKALLERKAAEQAKSPNRGATAGDSPTAIG